MKNKLTIGRQNYGNPYGRKSQTLGEQIESMLRDKCHAFSVSVANIVVDGQAALFVGGVNVGLITNAIAKATAIKRETTLGSPSVGYDLMVGADMTQTTSADWLAALAAVLASPQTLALQGARNTVTLANAFMSAELDMKFNNKSESVIKIEATKPGVTNATAGAWMSSS